MEEFSDYGEDPENMFEDIDLESNTQSDQEAAKPKRKRLRTIDSDDDDGPVVINHIDIPVPEDVQSVLDTVFNDEPEHEEEEEEAAPVAVPMEIVVQPQEETVVAAPVTLEQQQHEGVVEPANDFFDNVEQPEDEDNDTEHRDALNIAIEREIVEAATKAAAANRRPRQWDRVDRPLREIFLDAGDGMQLSRRELLRLYKPKTFDDYEAQKEFQQSYEDNRRVQMVEDVEDLDHPEMCLVCHYAVGPAAVAASARKKRRVASQIARSTMTAPNISSAKAKPNDELAKNPAILMYRLFIDNIGRCSDVNIYRQIVSLFDIFYRKALLTKHNEPKRSYTWDDIPPKLTISDVKYHFEVCLSLDPVVVASKNYFRLQQMENIIYNNGLQAINCITNEVQIQKPELDKFKTVTAMKRAAFKDFQSARDDMIERLTDQNGAVLQLLSNQEPLLVDESSKRNINTSIPIHQYEELL